MARKKKKQPPPYEEDYQFPTHCERCKEVLFDEIVITEEGQYYMKKCIMCGARYFKRERLQRKICYECGREFFVKSMKQKLCNECMKKKTNRKVEKICFHCGKKFLGFAKTKYCEKCRPQILSEKSKEYRRKKNAVSVS